MSADPLIEPQYTPTSGLAEAFYFDSGDHKLFGWLHRPMEIETTSMGVVICKPFGYEAICSHRSVRAFADAVMELGLPSLRFDYLGTGDSADIDPRADQIDVWAKDVVAAVIELQRRTGVEQVCLLGFRLGALLATLAAAQCTSVGALLLVAPVISGRRYLRELRTTRMFASLGTDGSGSAGQPSANQATGVDSMEISGFSLSAASIAALSQIDLTTRGAPPVRHILLIEGSNSRATRDWVEILTAIGSPPEYLTLPGTVEMLMTDPQFALVPQTMIEAMRGWLALHVKPPGKSSGIRQHHSCEAVSEKTVLSLPLDGSVASMVLTERPVFIGSETVSFGIVTEPRQGDKRRRGVILLNVGAENHIGSSRMYVSLARQWARQGYTVLRLDLAGLGDSATRAGRPDDEVFPPAAIEDIRAAIDFLKARYAIDDITLGGLCSGAYHSLRAAIVGLPVNRILLVNPMNFFWKEGMTAESLQQSVDLARNFNFYRERVFSITIWKRILSGKLNIWRIVRIFIHRPVITLESKLRNLARQLRIHLPRDLGWELEQIGARGVRMVFVFARGEPGIDVLNIEAGSSVKRLGDQCLVHIIDSGDHIFSRQGTRSVLEKILSNELYARIPGCDDKDRGG